MKHLLRIGLALSLTLSIYGCGGGEEDETTDAGTKVDAGKKDSGTTCNGEMCNGQCCEGETHCDTNLGQCVPNVCVPNCTGRYCGDPDGCNGKCTGCPSGQTCDPTSWQCKATTCTPNCSGKACGDADGCGGKCSGSCPTGQFCNASFTCQTGTCTPSCAGKACGDADGCGGKCYGTCAGNQVCNATTFVCEAAGSCDPSTCGQGQGCYNPVTGTSSGATVCTCLPATQTRPDTCAAYGLVCDMDLDNPAPASCRMPEVWDDCDPNGAGCAEGNICVPLQGGGGVCAAECWSPTSCDDPMTACFQAQGIGNFCWFNFCAENQMGVPDPSRFYQPCNSSAAGDGTCVPFQDGQGGVVGICFQGSPTAAGSLAACSPDATRSTPTELCPVGEFCLGWYPDPTNPDAYKGTCLPLCNSSTNPNPVKNCAAGFTCLDVTQENPSADLGICFRDCDVLATNTCPANGLGEPEGCSLASATTTEGLCWPHASPGSAVGAACSMNPDDMRESCVPGAACFAEQGAAQGQCYAFCDPAGSSGPACSGTCTPIDDGAAVGVCE
ncbi:MAG: hypothetical protein ACOX6T_13345 [Myxococcales bacterium]|jgi:hypothetical protein